MDLKQIKELMAAMERFRLNKVSLKEKSGFEIVLEKDEPRLDASAYIKKEVHALPEAVKVHAHPEVSTPPALHKADESKAGTFVASPMVGTFYRSPSPSDPVFVKIGDTVSENSVVCIIEAMKVMNEVKAQKSGKIVEILVENMQPVEFGTKLFRIE